MADYDSRFLLLSDDEFKRLNFQQNPNEKQAIQDEDPDVLDTLELNEEGFVVVPEERRNLIFSQDPDKFRTDPSRRFVDVGVSVDSTNITVKNNKFNLRVSKVFEDDDIIKYNVVLENVDNNCLVIDSVVQIAGTDLSLVNPETRISEDEQLLQGSVGQNGISKNKIAITNFIKKYRPDFDTLQSAIGNIPFEVVIPDFLEQVDARSLVLCPESAQTSDQPTERRGISNEQYQVNKAGLLPIQIAVIEEAQNWSGYQELRTRSGRGDNWPVTRVIKNSDGTLQEYADTRCVEQMKKYANHLRGEPWCAAFAHMIVGRACDKIANPFRKYIDPSRLNKGTKTSADFARKAGLLVNYLVPGCPAYFVNDKGDHHTILILEVRTASGKPNYAFDCKTIEGNTGTEAGIPSRYYGSSRIAGARPGYGGKIFTRRGNELYMKKYRFIGCAVPREVQDKAKGDYSIFITGNINY
jgi:hypothetical protein